MDAAQSAATVHMPLKKSKKFGSVIDLKEHSDGLLTPVPCRVLKPIQNRLPADNGNGDSNRLVVAAAVVDTTAEVTAETTAEMMAEAMAEATAKAMAEAMAEATTESMEETMASATATATAAAAIGGG